MKNISTYEKIYRSRHIILYKYFLKFLLSEVKAIKTYIRTKSGRLVERMVFVSAEDYEKMQKGDKSLAEQLLKKYLSADDAKNLQSWDKEEQRAIKVMIRYPFLGENN